MEKETQPYINETKEVQILSKQDLTINVKIDKSPIPHFQKEEINLLISNIPKPTHQMLMQSLWRTGVRVTECISITKSDIDFTNKIITIRWLKNRKAQYRVIPLHNSLAYALSVFVDKLKYDEFC